MEIKILATGDLHLGRRSSEVPAPKDFGSTQWVWKRLIDEAIRRKVDIVALTGDIIDRENRFFEAIGPLQEGFEILKSNGIEVYMVAGNHDFDVLPEIIDTESFPNVHLLGKDGHWETKIFEKENHHLRLAGRSFTTLHDPVDPLASCYLPDTDFDTPTVGLVHGDVDLPDSPYAPMDSNSFSHKGVDVWLLGHIHKPWIVRERNPHVRYPGSPQAMSSKEPGSHGAVLVTIRSKSLIDYEVIPLSPVFYTFLKVSLSNLEGDETSRDTVTQEIRRNAGKVIAEHPHIKMLVYDVLIDARTNQPAALEEGFHNMVSEYSAMGGSVEVTVRKLSFSIKPALDNLEELAKQKTSVGTLAETILALRNGEDTEWLRKLKREWADKFDKIGRSGTYLEYIHSGLYAPEQYSVDHYLLAECERMLGQLVQESE